MRFEIQTEDRKIVDFYGEDAYLAKLVEEMDELKKAIEWYRNAILKDDKDHKRCATARFLEEFADVAIKMRHVFEKSIRPNSKASEMCDRFETYKLARQMVRMGLRNESFGSNKQKE